MNRQNILSAGWMMAIVVALLGAFHCGVTVAQMRAGVIGGVLQPEAFRVETVWSVAFGGVLIVCGLALLVMFSLSARYVDGLGTPILAAGVLTALLGLAAVVLVWRNPISWMMAIVAIAIFIDALCLKISLASE